MKRNCFRAFCWVLVMSLAALSVIEYKTISRLRRQIEHLQLEAGIVREPATPSEVNQGDMRRESQASKIPPEIGMQSLRQDNQHSRLISENNELGRLQDEVRELREQAAQLAATTDQLFQSLVHYINDYSNSIPPEKRWAYSLAERARFTLAQSEDGRYILRRKGSDGTDRDWFGGNFTSIGIGDNHIFVRSPATANDPEGWRIIDLRSGAVNGPYEDSEFMNRPEVRGVRLMKPDEAWELMK